MHRRKSQIKMKDEEKFPCRMENLYFRERKKGVVDLKKN